MTRKLFPDLVWKLLSDDGEAGRQEARVSDGLDRPDDEAEDDEGGAVLDPIKKSEEDRAKSGQEYARVENSGKVERSIKDKSELRSMPGQRATFEIMWLVELK